jgi:hypothetical protein
VGAARKLSSSVVALDAHENGPRVCSFFGPTNLVRSGEFPLGILALDTLQRGRRLAERGRVIVPCKDWPSATAYGGCGLDKGLAPGPRLPPRDRRQGPLARANSGSANLSTLGSIPVSVEAFRLLLSED